MPAFAGMTVVETARIPLRPSAMEQKTVGYRIIALTVSTAIFMQFLDSTALNTALPAIAHDFHVQAVDLNVALLSYQLAMAALIPAGAALGDRIGARNAFAIALGVFLTGSVLCALSHTLPQLTAARALQGTGGAIMMPVSRLLVVRSAAKNELVSAMNWLLLPGIVGPLLGPGLGGLIVSYASWHWIFLINVPVALLGIALTFALIPNRKEADPPRFDLIGLLIVAPAITLFIFGLEAVTRPDGLWRAALLIATGIGLALLYLRHMRSRATPLLDLSIFRIASFRHATIASTLLRTWAGASGFLWPLWLQLGMKMTPAQAGAVLTMNSLGALSSRAFGSLLLRHVHPRDIAVWGVAAFALLLGLSVLLRPGLPMPLYFAMLFGQGVLIATPMMVIGAVIYVDLPAEKLGNASGLYTLIQQVTLSLGVTAGVWTIAATRWTFHTTLDDSRAYALAFALFAGASVVTVFTTRKIDAETTEVLRAQPVDAEDMVAV